MLGPLAMVTVTCCCWKLLPDDPPHPATGRNARARMAQKLKSLVERENLHKSKSGSKSTKTHRHKWNYSCMVQTRAERKKFCRVHL
jgi:hypothetical protein